MKCSGWHSVNGSLALSREEFPLHCLALWVIFPLASLGDISALQPVRVVKEITPSCEGDSPLGSNIPKLQPRAWHPETVTLSPFSLLPCPVPSPWGTGTNPLCLCMAAALPALHGLWVQRMWWPQAEVSCKCSGTAWDSSPTALGWLIHLLASPVLGYSGKAPV